ncbi:MAG: hypothetical protein KatS3mg060_3727 [Dehalococcoidia bacterium]|jgi:hypothetical protein|nr:MAG: hypothetical protein KatS3mg060_3727 [Dehalococcoidia bacterium]
MFDRGQHGATAGVSIPLTVAGGLEATVGFLRMGAGVSALSA